MRCRLCQVAVAWLAISIPLARHMWPEDRCCQHIELLPLAEATPALDHCALRSDGRHSALDLLEKGYARVPGFLAARDRELLLALNERLPPDPRGQNSGNNVGYRTTDINTLRLLVPGLLESISRFIKNALHDQHAGIDLRDWEMPSAIFINTNSSVPGSVMFPWHQDAESLFEHEDHMNCVNFYLMLAKEHPQEAGIQVVPFHTLLERAPQLFQLLVGAGATAFFPTDNGRSTLHWQGGDRAGLATDALHRLLFDLGELSCTPPLQGGDLLLLRGDTIHRTQPHRSWRIALTLRVYKRGPQTRRSLRRVLAGGLHKYKYMVKDPDKYSSIAAARALGSAALEGPPAAWGRALWIRYSLARWFLGFWIHVGFSYRVVLAPTWLLLVALQVNTTLADVHALSLLLFHQIMS